jgi:TldD protein
VGRMARGSSSLPGRTKALLRAGLFGAAIFEPTSWVGLLRQQLRELMQSVPARADYADARFVRLRSQRVSMRNQTIDTLSDDLSEGVGIRVRVNGAWGFATTHRTERRFLERALLRALDLAASQPNPRGHVVGLAPLTPASGTYVLSSGTDPFEVPLSDKLSVLGAACTAMGTNPGVEIARSHFLAFSEQKTFASTDGALYTQDSLECGGGIQAVATDGDQYQLRSYPASFRGDVSQAGFEHFLGLDLVGNAERISEEAVALLSARSCPHTNSALVLDGEQLALQLHESVGHAVELDRILGTESSYAGTSFLSPTDLGSFCYGSSLMNVCADASAPGGLGTFCYDDEGVAASATPIVTDGVLTGFLSSRETASQIGLPSSSGCMRASSYNRQPLVRMTNINLAPGQAGSLDELIRSTERGIYMETNRSWSIDSKRLNFQFSTEIAYEIVDGELGQMLKNPSYGGVTPVFWQSLDAICSPAEWRLWPVINCGKGEPGQSVRVSHGAAPARFSDVEVGVA